MAVRQPGTPAEFRELDFGEQAQRIAETIDGLQVAIEHHVAQSPRRAETLARCLGQIEQIEARLRRSFDHSAIDMHGGRPPTPPASKPRLRVGSPRLANPAHSADFLLDVDEVSLDAELR